MNRSSPNLSYITLSNNTGFGIYLQHADPIINHVFINNNDGLGIRATLSNPTLNHVTITNNSTSYAGAGIYFDQSNAMLNNVIIKSNTSGMGGGIYAFQSNLSFTNVTISDNQANSYGGGLYAALSNLSFTNVTISGNQSSSEGGGIILYDSTDFPTILNSIIWGNFPDNILVYNDIVADFYTPQISYSNIEGGWEGEGNINEAPLFTDPTNSDFSLQINSPCIDSGSPNLWYQDLDETRSDMGATGGLYVVPNFLYYDFGGVGDIGAQKRFTIYNYRDTPIIIESVNFDIPSFHTNTQFPIIIESLNFGIIDIMANNSILGFFEDDMEIISDDLPEDITIGLSGTSTEGNILSGNLSGTYPVANYRISSDLTIAEGDTVYLDAGTQFLFDDEVNFNIYGTLKAIGTKTDSIIFDNFANDKWSGFTLDGVTNETEFRYVQISGAEKRQADWFSMNNGGGMYLNNSHPVLNHVSINNNIVGTMSDGGGIYLLESNPILTHVNITDNIALTGGGIAAY